MEAAGLAQMEVATVGQAMILLVLEVETVEVERGQVLPVEEAAGAAAMVAAAATLGALREMILERVGE